MTSKLISALAAAAFVTTFAISAHAATPATDTAAPAAEATKSADTAKKSETHAKNSTSHKSSKSHDSSKQHKSTSGSKDKAAEDKSAKPAS